MSGYTSGRPTPLFSLGNAGAAAGSPELDFPDEAQGAPALSAIEQALVSARQMESALRSERQRFRRMH
jgi:hypothetical protein